MAEASVRNVHKNYDGLQAVRGIDGQAVRGIDLKAADQESPSPKPGQAGQTFIVQADMNHMHPLDPATGRVV